jgi:ATP-dependent exoDNAse (exonuclease V) alpha subunit
MGLFGEAGTGKSWVVNEIRAWFASHNRSKELIVTATTGTAAFDIQGETLHSALGIAVERNKRNIKMGKKKKDEWAPHRYLIIDEVSMLDCKMMIKLHNKLCSANSSRDDVIFGDFNILFLGDFLQLPSVSPYYLYTKTSQYELGHHLWRSLNAVVILTEQMRQAGDLRYVQLLHRLRIRRPTAEDIQLLLGRNVIVDLKKPSGRGASAATSVYYQLSRATALNRVSIMRPFDIAELTAPLPPALVDELDWQEEMAAKTRLMS